MLFPLSARRGGQGVRSNDFLLVEQSWFALVYFLSFLCLRERKEGLKHQIKDYFTFNKRERNGVFVLLSIIISQLIYLSFVSSGHSTQTAELSIYDPLADKLRDSKNDTLTVVEAPERFDFDPNNMQVQEWKRLGFNDKQIRSIQKYQAKGGKFRSKEDLQKMYCIGPEQYASLEPYILITSAPKRASYQPQSLGWGAGRGNSHHPPRPLDRGKEPSKIQSPAKLIELNTCDSVELLSVKGIGPFYAHAIIKYRAELGGYLRKEQLMELWKFDQEKYDKVAASFIVDPSLVKKLNINTYSPDELKHPYISWTMAHGIVNYRAKHGKFKTIEEIVNTDLVNEETLLKIAGYLVVE
jgi:DNA uptake protein ComE-like DNA-binding protein